MGAITLEDLHKSYGKTKIIHGIDLNIADGEFVVFVGPSGCGKSTLLRMIAGLEDISAGSIYIGDKLVNDLDPKARNIAMVFQNYAIYPHMTVRQNIAIGLYTAKYSKDEKQRRVEETAELLELTPYLDRRPAALSGGQRQRVAIGRAMVRDPSVFLFDEPLSNLDAQLRTQMRIEIKNLHTRLGTTIIYVTHDQIEAMTMADRIVVMKSGRILQSGSPLELYESPADVFTARFIGSPSMNMVRGKEVNGTFHPDPEGTILLGMRPQDLAVGQIAENTAIQLSGTVKAVEPLGSETFVHMSLGSQSIIASAPGSLIPDVGSEIMASLPEGKLYLFEQSSERFLERR